MATLNPFPYHPSHSLPSLTKLRSSTSGIHRHLKPRRPRRRPSEFLLSPLLEQRSSTHSSDTETLDYQPETAPLGLDTEPLDLKSETAPLGLDAEALDLRPDITPLGPDLDTKQTAGLPEVSPRRICSLCQSGMADSIIPYGFPKTAPAAIAALKFHIQSSSSPCAVCHACWVWIHNLSLCWTCGETVSRNEGRVSFGWCWWHWSCVSCLFCRVRIFPSFTFPQVIKTTPCASHQHIPIRSPNLTLPHHKI